jgi:hypothetical protein
LRDGVLRDVASGAEIRRMPVEIEGFTRGQQLGDYVAYDKGSVRRIYSWHTGELVATHDLIGNMMHIQSMSRDAQVVQAHGWQPGTGPWSATFFDVITDTSGNVKQGPSNGFGTLRHGAEGVISPDGRFVVRDAVRTRPRWLPRWWPMEDEIATTQIVERLTEARLGAFPRTSWARFSPRGNLLALVREDYGIDVYEIPLRPPWLLIVAAAIFAGGALWGIGWSWSRWRKPASQPSASQAPSGAG